MFFVSSKILGLVFQPLNFLILMGCLGLALSLVKFRRTGAALASTAIVLLAVVSFVPVGRMLLVPLENRFHKPDASMPAPTGIIVLGGSVDTQMSEARGEPIINEAAERLTVGVALARRYPQARLVFTGGSGHLRAGGPSEAAVVHEIWTSLGLPDDRMSFEDKSRNTYENATMTRALVDPKPGETWLLLTSASHMPRSVGIFREIGWPVVAYPVGYRTSGDAHDVRPNGESVYNLWSLELAFHEWAGLLAYRLTGKTDAFFPAP